MKNLFATVLWSSLAAPLAVAATPDAGTLLQQLQPPAPAAPTPSQPGPRIEAPGTEKLPASAPFQVKRIRITGNTVFDTSTLHALVSQGEDRALTLPQVGELAGLITRYYQSHGYPLARAIVPAQKMEEGVLTIQVIEARYGRIALVNDSRVRDDLLQQTLAPLQSGQLVEQPALDHALQLLSDLPAVSIDAVLKPGESVGTSDLEVRAAPKSSVIGNVTLDSYGIASTGRARAGATVSVFNPLNHGDTFSLGALTSGRGLNYLRLGYDSVLNGHGTRLGGGYSALRYELGDGLSALDAHGSAQVVSLWGKHPLVRSRGFNLYGQLQYDRKQLRDRIDTVSLRNDRHLDNWVLSVNGDSRDAWLSGGLSAWGVGWTQGRVGFDDAAAQAMAAATARTQGSFSKLNANYSRLQTLATRDALYVSLAGQWSEGNLDSAEKLSVGGPSTVRAYAMSAASVDEAYLASVEWRHDLGSTGYGFWQAVAFVDSARVTVNKTPWIARDNRGTLSGAGVGLNWVGPQLWQGRISVASRLGARPAFVGDSSTTRGWLEISKAF